MVSLSAIQASNANIASALPAGLVAVFVGATSGIGETALKQFARHTRQPRIYFVGRSDEAGKRVADECRSLNKDGQYNFVRADVGLIRSVDDVCRDITAKETAINLLFLTPGTMVSHTETAEKLHLATALVYHSRTRFIVNLLPLLQRATSLRRVVTVFAGGKEGNVDTNDLQAWKVPMLSTRGHVSSMVTVSLETLAKQAPEVSFVHAFPGAVKTNLSRGAKSLSIVVLRAVFKVIGPLIYIPNEEVGERQLFLATSARYPPSAGGAEGVPLAGAVAVARGTDGKAGSGVYSVDQEGETSDAKVELLTKLRKEGVPEKVWNHTEEEFKRITGVEAV